MLNTVIHGDCLIEMQKIADKSVDMILCDLPFGTTACKWDTIIPFEPLWVQYKRIIKDNGAIVLTASQPFTTKLIASNFGMFKYEWIWEKNFSGGFILAKQRPMKYHENILIFAKSNTVYNPQFREYSESTKKRFKNNGKVNSSKMIKSDYANEVQKITRVEDEIHLNRGAYPQTVLKFNAVPNCNGTKLHPTQKPVALFEYLIKTYTNDNETVLDNCAGSGTTAIACMNTNRNYILIEKEQKYIDIINNRIENHRNLFTKEN